MTLDDLDLQLEISRNFAWYRRFGRQQWKREWR